MAKIKVTEIVTRIVDILTPLSTEERRRVIGASLTLLGDEPGPVGPAGIGSDRENGEDVSGLSPRVKAWMKQNNIALDDLQQVFHIAEGVADVIASDIPGKNDKEKTYSAYVLTGISKFLSTGNPLFDDKSARAFCKASGCLNIGNHSAYLSGKGNEFTGSKGKGWTLTSPGLKRGAVLVKELAKEQK